MRIQLSPIRSDDHLSVIKNGDALTINGVLHDFSSILDGEGMSAEEVNCAWITEPVRRVSGELLIALLLPHGADPEPWQAFPAPLENVPDGPLDLPVNTIVTVEFVPTEGGVNKVTTIKRWHQPDQVETDFIQNLAVDA